MLPQEFLERMENMLGEEYPAFLKSYDIARYQALRLNPQKGDDVSLLNRGVFSLERVPWAEHGYYYTAKDTPGKHPYHEAGVYYIQEPSAMAPAEYLEAKPGERILDLCAAPGGKSMNVALKLTDGSVEARDLTPLKTQLIRENIARLGLDNISVKEWDARVSDTASKESADIVLADLPCSGLGIIGRKPDIKYYASKEKEEELVRIQRAILANAASYVKPGGTLLYSTCTVNRKENGENAAWFLEQFPFEAVSLDELLPDELKSGETAKGQLQLIPGVHKTDGFFLAKFRKTEEGRA